MAHKMNPSPLLVLENTLVIRDLDSLQTWRQQLRNTMWTRNLPLVQVQLQGFSAEQNRRFSALVRGLQTACGCTSSGFFMSATVVVTVVSYFVSGNHLSDIALQHMLLLVGSTILAALCGKFLGLFWARWRLLRFATSMHKKIVNEKPLTLTTSS